MAYARRRSRPQEATHQQRKAKVTKFFAAHGQRVFLSTELGSVLSNNRETFGFPQSYSATQFRDFLLGEQILEKASIQQIEGSQSELIRYVVPDTSAYAVAQTLRRGSYLSHASSIFLHGITQQIPKTIYVNKEQSPKPSHPESLTQEGIDRAFSNRIRTSNYVFGYKDFKIVVLSGKATNQLEVDDLEISPGEKVRTTRLERALIDIAVRPNYAGGVFEVLEAYRAAADRISVNLLVATLKRLGYVYPYHQAIGFYLERAGVAANQLAKVRSLGISYKFYLTNQISDHQYDSNWMVYFPQGL
jgi:predicted transcriptional regulator of viral defense system